MADISNNSEVDIRTELGIDEKTGGWSKDALGAIEANDKVLDLESQLTDLSEDGVTGLPPRKVFDRESLRYMNEIKRKKEDGTGLEHFGAVLLDIGNFKDFNDTHGHKTGDQVLKLVSDGFKSALRSSDILGRYGGDELAAVLTNLSESDTEQFRADIIRERIQSYMSKNMTSDLSKIAGEINVDVGVSYGKPGDNFEIKMDEADKMMYENKKIRKGEHV